MGDGLSWRRLRVLVDNLPGDDLFALGLSERPDWGWDRELLRTLIDAIVHNTWTVRDVFADKKSKTEPPEPIARPWEESAADKAKASMRQQLLAQRERIRKEREQEAVTNG